MKKLSESKLHGNDGKAAGNAGFGAYAMSEAEERRQIELAMAASMGTLHISSSGTSTHSSNATAAAAASMTAAAAAAGPSASYRGVVRVDADGNKLTDEGRVIQAGGKPSPHVPRHTPDLGLGLGLGPVPTSGSMADTNRQMDLVIRMKSEFLEQMRLKYNESKRAFTNAYKVFLSTQLESYLDLQTNQSAELAEKERVFQTLNEALTKKVSEIREYLTKVRTDIKVDLPAQMDLQAKIVELRTKMTAVGEIQFLNAVEGALKQKQLLEADIAAMKNAAAVITGKVKELSELMAQVEHDLKATALKLTSFTAVVKHFAATQAEHAEKGKQLMSVSAKSLYDKESELFNTYASSILFLKEHQGKIKLTQAELKKFKEVREEGAKAEAVEVAMAADAAEAAKAAAVAAKK